MYAVTIDLASRAGGIARKEVKMERKSQHVALDNSCQSLIEKGLETNSGNETLTKQTLEKINSAIFCD